MILETDGEMKERRVQAGPGGSRRVQVGRAYWSWLLKNSPEPPLVSVSVRSGGSSDPSTFSSLICKTAQTKRKLKSSDTQEVTRCRTERLQKETKKKKSCSTRSVCVCVCGCVCVCTCPPLSVRAALGVTRGRLGS